MAQTERKAPVEEWELEPHRVLMLIDERFGPKTSAVGRDAIVRWIEDTLRTAKSQRAYFLFGTHHDSGEQLEIFRGLIGPGGIPGVTHVVVEQLKASGRWAGVEPEAQEGDDDELARFSSSGDRGAFARLHARQTQTNYTGWKYRYVNSVLDLLLLARPGGPTLLGCDVPEPLRARLPRDAALRDSVREIHCNLALEDAIATGDKALIAMVWGQAHLAQDAYQRFVPSDARVLSLYTMGTRPSGLSPEAQLSEKLILNDEVLLTLDEGGQTALLLLNGRHLGGRLDQTRLRGETPPSQRMQVTVSSTRPGVLKIGGKTVKLGSAKRSITLSQKGLVPYFFKTGDSYVLGSLDMPLGTTAHISFVPEERYTRLVVFEP